MSKTTIFLRNGFLVILASMFAGLSYAEVSFNGFASIRAVNADTEGPNPTNGDWDEDVFADFKSESLFALQARTDLGEKFSATVQFMAEGTNDFDTEAKWAYASYVINDNNTLNVGRFANPIFYQSEYENVGYAHNFSRLPRAVYTGFPFATVEGVSLDSNYYLGDFYLTTKLLYGNWDGSIFFSAVGQELDFGLKDLVSFRADLSRDWWRVFVGAFISELDGGGASGIDNFITGTANQIITGTPIPATAAEIEELNDAMTWDGKDGIYAYAGFGIEHSGYILDFEIADYGVEDSVDAFNTAWFLSLGYRIRPDLVVTAHREYYKQDTEEDDFGGVSNANLAAVAAGIQNTLGAQEFKGNGLSVNYDFDAGVAFKFDAFFGEDRRSDRGDYRVLSAGVDLVF